VVCEEEAPTLGPFLKEGVTAGGELFICSLGYCDVLERVLLF
jgi:hypothetical protein